MTRRPRPWLLACLVLSVAAAAAPTGASASGPLVDGGRAALRTAAPQLGVSLCAAAAWPAGAPLPAGTPLPACRYQDLPTRFTGYRQWRKTLVDTNLMVGRSYTPPGLVSVGRAGIGGSALIRRLVIDDLRALADAARAAGKPITIRTAYRSYAFQQQIFEDAVRDSGYEQALLYVARPGHSEHQLGTTADFASASGAAPWDVDDWGRTPAGRWMRQNAWRYGWVMSYPAGEKDTVCYGYEPWHWRYVGRAMAAEVRASGLTLREFLWSRFESQP
jgi:D-alanyl-D-alanine carboxypeptidase